MPGRWVLLPSNRQKIRQLAIFNKSGFQSRCLVENRSLGVAIPSSTLFGYRHRKTNLMLYRSTRLCTDGFGKSLAKLIVTFVEPASR